MTKIDIINIYPKRGVRKQSSSSSIDPNYISGLIQSDGSFFISIAKNRASKFGLRVRPKLSITQDLGSKVVLERIQAYFQFEYSYISVNNSKNSAELVISSIKDIKEKVIPHISRYPVFLGKQLTFLVLKEVIALLGVKPYSRLELAKIIKLTNKMNIVTNRGEKWEEELLSFIGVTREIEVTKPIRKGYPIEDQFIVGEIDGDGSFHVSFLEGGNILLGFHMTQDKASTWLLGGVKQIIGCGRIVNKETEIRYQVDSRVEMIKILIPFMDKYTLHTSSAIMTYLGR